MAITGLMLAAAMAVTVHVVGWVASESRSVTRRERALVEAANLMERLTIRPYEEITPESAAGLELPDAARSTLPGATLIATIEESVEAPARKRITVEIRWLGRQGLAESPVRLVSWIFKKGGRP